MPTDTENVLFLYLILTNDGVPSIDWASVASAMSLKPGAVSKRWSRLKQSIEKSETPAASNYPFLWLCLKYSKKNQTPDWAKIAEACDTTSGAASKRYSRMKQAFEQNAAPPGTIPDSPSKTPNKPKATPKKGTGIPSANEADENVVTPTPKRKRAPPKKKTAIVDEELKSNTNCPASGDDAYDEEVKPKRAKSTKPKATLKRKTKPQSKTEAKTEVKTEIQTDIQTDTALSDSTDADMESAIKRDTIEPEETFFDAAQHHVEGDAIITEDQKFQAQDLYVNEWLDDSV